MTVADETHWENRAKGLLKSEIKRRNLTYAQVVDKLAAIGVQEDERNFRNKVARGKFTAAFLLQCLEAIGAQSVRLDDFHKAAD
ncbi:hypothetical protein JDN40_04000 [Rhodomicrobium vannielii ATCC 17100]|nr:DUF6471 domain-containing protein [Rhodomicrobium vannielii]MBJ7533269.1 hypothetical protein [Rhodomicrobium vannielii ATCC 17100]